MMVDRVFQLTGTCNNYKWGKKGRDSLAAQLHAKTDPNFQIKDDERYSELWFGDYPKSPARVLKTGELLKDVLDKNPEILLGKKVIEELGAQLPYLPKILSIDKALQLQIHPNKALAAKLHAHDPAQFTDPNHKPEIAIVLDRFETFAGFKPLASIQPLFLCLPVLGHFVPAGANPHAWTDDTLREVVRALLKADDRLVQTVQEALLATPREKLGEAGYILDLLPRLQEQHGATDAGSLVALLLMNFLDLGPGEAVFIPADGIHAYLSGNIVECMARSDNVLCLGFCPRGERDDVDLFADTVRFEGAHSVGDVYLPGVKTSKTVLGALLFITHIKTSTASDQASNNEQCGWGLPRSPLQSDRICFNENTSSDPSQWAPWTHKPHCIPAADIPWCIFTNAAVPNKHGISIITTPEIAADSLDLLSHSFSLPFHAPEKLYKTRPYEVRDVPGKGRGAVATQRIEKDRVILIDHATILATIEYPADVMREEVRDLMDRGVMQLSEPWKVTSLARKDREEDDVSEMEDVLVTNSFVVKVGPENYMALFPDLARVNHACNPNAFIHFSEKTLGMTVWSSRDIEPGEEITITYSDAGLLHAERQERLQSVWGFKCTCSLCTAPPEVRNASDTRRLEIRNLQEEVLNLAQKGDFPGAVTTVERLFEVIEEEGLTEQMGDLYEIPARLYYHVGKLEKAREFTKLAMHELDGYGAPGPVGEERVRMLRSVLGKIEGEIQERNKGKEEEDGEESS
ncbi:RmlC-like cupin domain-containing protein [Bombardia bombarda]|uniref:Mannose-6-phosphate isomerase n=1 Tax=Bombardia bombarda TaxID=252184 RepID=A0AA39X0G8_9PEZI|nr:RmlC-like cupin domain-containing protein [Bombardia bombarda]